MQRRPVESVDGVDANRARGRSSGRASGRGWAALPVLAVLLGLGLLGGLGAPDARGQAAKADTPEAALAARLERALASPALKRAAVSALVVRERDGAVLFAREPDRALTPASNQKILTALAALSTFGPTHQFETVVWSDRPPDADGAVGSLVVQGSGDPVMNNEDWWRVADALRQAGLRKVDGDLVLDDRLFGARRWHPSWGRTSSRAYHAPVGALTANYGAFAVTVTPGAKRGDPVAVEVDPPVPYLQLSNEARTAAPRERGSLVVDRAADGDREVVMVRGRMSAGLEPKTYYRSVLDPARYAGAVLRMQLAAVGIEVAGGTRRGAAEDAGHELLRFEGRPMSEIVRLFVKYSNNSVAESLVKSLGVEATGVGTWANGTPEVERVLVRLGLDRGAFHVVDGSGLSYENKVSPRALVQALRIGRGSFAYGPELVAALPIANADGTLEKRAEDSRGEVRAKTGLLNGVTGLSGFAHLGDGGANGAADVAIFSLLVNGYRVDDEAAMAAVDGFVAELVSGVVRKASPSRRPGLGRPVAGTR